MKRMPMKLVAVVLGFILFAPTPARAGSVWDANDPGHKLDIRWVGVYQQPDGRMRVTMSFYDRVRLRWFRRGSFWDSTSAIGFTGDRRIGAYYFVVFFVNGRHRLSAALCESGSGCGGIARVRHPDRRTIRARIEPIPGGYGPAPGWYFRGLSWAADFRSFIDRTPWARFT